MGPMGGYGDMTPMSGASVSPVSAERGRALHVGIEDIDRLRSSIENDSLDPDKAKAAAEALSRLEAAYRPLTFTDVNQEDMERLQRATLREEAVATLVRCMGLKGSGGFQEEILVEYHYHNYAFCQQSGLGPAKASTFLSIMKALHTRAIVQEQMPVEQARQLFDELMERHCRQLPPRSVGVLTRDEAEMLRAFAERSFFQLYTMYGFVYVAREDIEIRTKDRGDVPRLPGRAAFRASDEVNPHEVPELAHFFTDPAEEAAKAAAAAAEAAAAEREAAEAALAAQRTAAQDDDREGDEVTAAIDEAMAAHWGAIDDRFQVPALPD
eukprot:TRINITY_DN63778_c0_g1_i1.p1 TRINITY_DN63778_c0_g1~~TRINITY_DN63778_c0_g1_i1.p1  ORF type:complete len:355 (+),score=83.64 TRINITY_DN63778_c0_g1_i1:93-1067(+)